MTVFDHVVIPVASEKDAVETCTALQPYLDEIQRVTAVHVIEKAGGAPDKAPLAKRREDAAEVLALVDTRLNESVPVDTRTVYGTDVAERLFETADDIGGSAIAFHARGGSRIVRLLTGDIAIQLVTEPPIPVVSLPSQQVE